MIIQAPKCWSHRVQILLRGCLQLAVHVACIDQCWLHCVAAYIASSVACRDQCWLHRVQAPLCDVRTALQLAVWPVQTSIVPVPQGGFNCTRLFLFSENKLIMLQQLQYRNNFGDIFVLINLTYTGMDAHTLVYDCSRSHLLSTCWSVGHPARTHHHSCMSRPLKPCHLWVQ